MRNHLRLRFECATRINRQKANEKRQQYSKWQQKNERIAIVGKKKLFIAYGSRKVGSLSSVAWLFLLLLYFYFSSHFVEVKIFL
jgi:hypothetical protein